MMELKVTRRSATVGVADCPWLQDIENRSWNTRYRGTLLIQASAKLPAEFETGGIIGMVQLVDCVTSSRSKWFEGPVGWVLTKPKRLPFIPLKGRLGLFDPPQKVMRQLGRTR